LYPDAGFRKGTILSKVILGVHGLGNKPPKELLQEWWKRSLCDGLNAIGQPQPFLKFEIVYWANYIHPISLDPQEKNKDNPLYIEDPYVPMAGFVTKTPSKLRKKILDYLEKQVDKLILNEDHSINFSIISDLIIHHFFNDLDIYYKKESQDASKPDVSARKAIQDELITVLKKNKGKKILLIAHSMGSIIAFDVLSQNPDLEVDTFVTIGSPLGLPIIMKKMNAESKINLEKTGKMKTPDSIRRAWHNFSDLEDKVAMNYNLSDDYDINIYNVQPIDHIVFNNYVIHNVRNPHKAYGYLRTMELAQEVYNFLIKDRSKLMIWITEKFNRWYSLSRVKQ
jgi:hypothetical protein